MLSLISHRPLPIAWLLLSKQPARFMTAILGVAFAGILILVQLAIQDALYNSSIAIVKKFDAELVMISQKSASLTGLAPFAQPRLANAFTTESVQEVYPIRWRYVNWRLPGERLARLAIAIGINPAQPVFNDAAIRAQQQQLSIPGRILYDSLSRPEFGPVQKEFLEGRMVVAYAGDQRLKVAGLAKLGPSFGYDSSFITSQATVESIYPDSAGQIELGLIKLRAGVNAETALKQLTKSLPPDVTLMTLKQFADSEKKFWSSSKPIGYVFLFCAVMGLAVGAMMVYQLLSMDVSFHLPAYALMLSIGYKRLRLESIVFMQGLILSVLGFPISWLVSSMLCQLIANSTSLPMALPMATIATTFLLIVFMCSASSLLAMSKLNDADPAELFG